METIQVVPGDELLRAVGLPVRRTKQSGSMWIRGALREHLKRLAIRELEERDRRGYEKVPAVESDLSMWDTGVVWPGTSTTSHRPVLFPAFTPGISRDRRVAPDRYPRDLRRHS
jgi:hypothetical protein